jgi:hypothetical protein
MHSRSHPSGFPSLVIFECARVVSFRRAATHQDYRRQAGPSLLARQHANCGIELKAFLLRGLQQELARQLDAEPEILAAVQSIVAGKTDIYAATDHILGKLRLARDGEYQASSAS